MTKIVISYAYFETDVAKYNFEFFASNELKWRDDIDYIIVINGHKCSVRIPSLPNVTVIQRENIGFDFGAYNAACEYIEKNEKTYDYFVFLNSGVFGPVMPHYSNQFLLNFHWSSIFINKINHFVKLVGTTIVCLPMKDAGGYGPKIEGFFFATDSTGYRVLREKGTIFQDHATKHSAIVNGEYGLSRAILESGFTIDCMLTAYQGIDWKNKNNWNQNKNLHASRKGKYFGKSIDPYEVIFHKWKWTDSEKVNFEIIDQYKKFSQNK